MKIALVQINSTVGDFEGNANLILKKARELSEQGCGLAVFPELSLFGYPPLDLLERPSVVQAQLKALKSLNRLLPKSLKVLLGAVTSTKGPGKPYQNSAVLLEASKKPKVFAKTLLPSYDVFDETRFFEPGRLSENIFNLSGLKILVTVCEDGWYFEKSHQKNYSTNPYREISKSRVDLILNISASPFSLDKPHLRERAMIGLSKTYNSPLIYVNAVGAQDELVFDGGSFAVCRGRVMALSRRFEEDTQIVETNSKLNLKCLTPSQKKTGADPVLDLAKALELGVKDFVRKTGQKRVHLGLSGGVDSAVVACIAAKALGPELVTLIGMPGPFSADISLKLARELAGNLGCRFIEAPIEQVYKTTKQVLDKTLEINEFGLVHENLQARLRGLFLMAFSNSKGSLLLTTGNKSEYATGYSTLYGDMCGGLAPIGDLLKGQVWALANAYNRDREIIPEAIIHRAPSAELRPNQTDQDTLPPYEELDQIVEHLVVERRPVQSDSQEWVLGALNRSEFKRWQAPPILRVSPHAFGRGRRMPIAHKSRW